MLLGESKTIFQNTLEGRHNCFEHLYPCYLVSHIQALPKVLKSSGTGLIFFFFACIENGDVRAGLLIIP